MQTDSHARKAPRPRSYLRNELEEGVGVEGANGQGYEVEEQALVKGLLHERHHASPDQGAEGNDGHTEETVTPDWRGSANPVPMKPQVQREKPGARDEITRQKEIHSRETEKAGMGERERERSGGEREK